MLKDVVTHKEKRNGKKAEYLFYSILAAVVALVPLLFYLGDRRFSTLYLLFIGNVLFGIMIGWYSLHVIRNHSAERPGPLVRQGQIVTIAGTGCAVVLSIITVLLYCWFSGWQTGEPVLAGFPPGFRVQSMGGLIGLVVCDVAIGDISMGTFVNALTVFAEKRMRK